MGAWNQACSCGMAIHGSMTVTGSFFQWGAGVIKATVPHTAAELARLGAPTQTTDPSLTWGDHKLDGITCTLQLAMMPHMRLEMIDYCAT